MSENTATDPVLVVSLTHWAKQYALERFLEAYEAFTYPAKSLFVVDSSPTRRYFHYLRSRNVPCGHVEPRQRRITVDFEAYLGYMFDDGIGSVYHRGWRRLADEAQRQNCPFMLNLDSDLICPPDTIERLLAHVEDDTWAVLHAVPMRVMPSNWGISAGFALYRTTALREAIALYGAGKTQSQSMEVLVGAIDGGDWGSRNGWRMVKIKTPEIITEHLDGFGDEYYPPGTEESEKRRETLIKAERWGAAPKRMEE